MSANEYPVFFNSTMLDTTLTTLYTVPSDISTKTLQNLQLKFTDVTVGAAKVSAYAVPDGGSASNDNAICIDSTVPANDYILVPVERLPAGATIQAKANAAATVNVQPIGCKLHTP